jgi:hypothetical protein
MNKLTIRKEYDGTVSDPIYYVEDSHTLYMRTRDIRVAQHTYNQLKTEYERGKKNASKV